MANETTIDLVRRITRAEFTYARVVAELADVLKDLTDPSPDMPFKYTRQYCRNGILYALNKLMEIPQEEKLLFYEASLENLKIAVEQLKDEEEDVSSTERRTDDVYDSAAA